MAQTTLLRTAQPVPHVPRHAAPLPAGVATEVLAPAVPSPQQPAANRKALQPAPPLGWFMVGVCLTILAAMLLGFALELSVVGNFRHYRDQVTAYANFRIGLQDGTAPVSQTDFHGKLLKPGVSVAFLEIPDIGVHEVVFEGTTSGILESGPGHLRDTVLPGQVGTSEILGRQAAFGGPFGSLHKLKQGSLIAVKTGGGPSQYKVIDIRHAGDPVPPAPAAGAGRLVLVTGDGPTYAPRDVLRVDADLVSTPQPTGRLLFGASALSAAERPMASNQGAWMNLVLWAEALLVVSVLWVWLRAVWGRWQVWVVGTPVLIAVGIGLAAQAAQLLPNLL
jgi:sortase A